MELFILPILLSLGVQSGLNWNLVLFQRNHISKSFLGVFSVSLAVVDTTLTLCVGALHFAEGSIAFMGLKFTRFHICLLVQILGQVYSSLQGPVLCLATLDHFCTVTHRLHPTTARARLFVYVLVTTFLLFAAIFYVFLLSDFEPVLADVPHSQIRRCWVFHAPQMLQVAMVALALGCAVVHVCYSTGLLKALQVKERTGAESGSRRGRSLVHQTTETLLSTWTPLLLLLVVLLLLRVGIPAHLGLNAAWICFLNSLLIAAVVCVAHPAVQSAQDLATLLPDSFCEWRLKFSLAAEDTEGLRHTPVVSCGN